MRSWNGVQLEPGVAVAGEPAHLFELLSTAMNCLSSSGRNERWKPVSKTGRPVKFHEAPPFWVERKTKKPLARSGSPAVAGPRLKSWQDRYALPFESNATDVSPEACQYSRGNEFLPRVKPFGTVESFHVRPPSVLHDVPHVPSPRR